MKIIGDMHTHTIASTHAYSTILENCQSASRKGIELIAMTDHYCTMPDAPHIWHFENMKCLPRKISDVTVLHGVEANIIDEDGHVDMAENLLSKMEWVVASMHKDCYRPTDVRTHTNAYLAIAENPYVDVIGHCTTASFPFDMERCVKKFKECGKLIEINESSIINKKGSKENSYELLKLCKKYDVPVVVDSDGHFCELIGVVDNAMKIMEELDFPEELVMNSDYEKIKEYVLAKHPDINI